MSSWEGKDLAECRICPSLVNQIKNVTDCQKSNQAAAQNFTGFCAQTAETETPEKTRLKKPGHCIVLLLLIVIIIDTIGLLGEVLVPCPYSMGTLQKSIMQLFPCLEW